MLGLSMGGRASRAIVACLWANLAIVRGMSATRNLLAL